jgi:putative ABC transport system substrate-binding protein
MNPTYDSFRQGLRELGYVEGRNIAIEWRFAQRKPDQLAKMAAELVRLKVDVIVTGGPPAPFAARKATRTIPIVVAVNADYVGQGLVESLRRPGGNLTGLSAIGPELIGKQLQFFKEAIPRLSRVAILRNPTHRAHSAMVKQAEKAARVLGLRIVVVDVSSTVDFPGAFRRVEAEGVDGVLVLRGGLFIRNRSRVTKLAIESALPTMFGHRQEAEAGGLMAYGTDVADLFRRAATYVDKILKGANPAEMPIEQPTKFDFVVNIETAKTLGITFPQSILLRATKVIE